MSLKFCANLSCIFTESSSFLERYELASQAGFKNVECLFPYSVSIDEVVRAKKTANVKQILINSYPGNLDDGDLGLAALPGRQDEFKDSLKKSIDYAKALDCDKIHIMAGKSLLGIIDTAMGDVYHENLQYSAKILEENGIVGLIEPISKSAVSNYYMDSFDDAVAIIKKVNSNSLKLLLDVYHLQLLKGNLTNNIRNLLPYTGHIQISQVPDRGQPDAAGEINYQYILQLLDELGYDGYIGLEYKPGGTSVESIGWINKWGYSL